MSDKIKEIFKEKDEAIKMGNNAEINVAVVAGRLSKLFDNLKTELSKKAPPKPIKDILDRFEEFIPFLPDAETAQKFQDTVMELEDALSEQLNESIIKNTASNVFAYIVDHGELIPEENCQRMLLNFLKDEKYCKCGVVEQSEADKMLDYILTYKNRSIVLDILNMITNRENVVEKLKEAITDGD